MEHESATTIATPTGTPLLLSPSYLILCLVAHTCTTPPTQPSLRYQTSIEKGL